MPATSPTKPTVRNPLWASDPGQTLDPGVTQEANGWDADDQPPARWWNWILNAGNQWIQWSETAIDELFTEKFDKTAIETLEWISPMPEIDPRLKCEVLGGADIYRNWIETRGASLNKVRLYSSGTEFLVATNLRYDGGAAWTAESSAAGYLQLSGRDNYGVALPPNTMTPVAVPKAFGKIEVSGGSGAVDSGEGLTSTVTLSSTQITINMANAMDSTDYYIQVTNSNSLVPMFFTATPLTVSQFAVRAHDFNGTLLDPTANAIQFFVEVKGRQPRP